MEEMYDDIDDVHGLLTTVADEDSVDIYSGLDPSPSYVAEKPCELLSPRLKESLDLYEEIITEEQQSKESSYNQLKVRFVAAQKQIEELRSRLQQTETQNTGLNIENTRLKKNISALLKTARQEVLRKDEEIQRLNKWSGKGRPHQPRMNGLRDPNSARHNSSCSSTSKPAPPPPPPADPPPLRLPPAPAPPPPPPADPPPLHLPPAPAPPLPPSQPSQERELPRKESKSAAHHSNVETRVSRSPSEVLLRGSSRGDSEAKLTDNSVSKSSTNSSSGPIEPDKQSKHREEKHENQPLPPSQPSQEYELPRKESKSAAHHSNASCVETRVSRSPSEVLLRGSSRGDSEAKLTDSSVSKSSTNSSSGPIEPDKQSKHREEKHENQRLPPSQPSQERELPRKESNSAAHHSNVETRVSGLPSKVLLRGSSRGDSEAKLTDNSVSKSSTNSSSGPIEPDKHKQPKHREETHENQRPSESTDRRHKLGSDPNKECHIPEKKRSHKAEKEAGKKYDYKSCKSRNYPNVEGHHRSERAKSPPPPEVLRGAASTDSGDKGFSDDTKGRSRERKQDKAKTAGLDSVHSRTSTPGSKDSSKISSEMQLKGSSRRHRTNMTGDGHRQRSDSKDRKESCSNQNDEQSSSKFSQRKGRGSPSKDHRRKEARRREDEMRRGDKGSTVSERSRDSEKKRSKERDQGKMDVSSKNAEKKTIEASKRVAEDPKVSGKTFVEENSPNRKLCFMETLNLTLSPVKKPLLPIAASQQGVTPVDEVFENGLKDSEQPDMEDLCVIDETYSSESETVDDVIDGKAAKSSSDIPKTPEIIDGKRDGEEVAQEQDKTPTEATVAGEQLEDSSVQTTSSCRRLPAATAHLTPKSAEMSLVPATDGDISETTGDSTKCLSDVTIVESGDLEATARLTGMSGSTPTTLDTCISLQEVSQPGESEPTVLDSSTGTPGSALLRSPPVDTVKADQVASCSKENPAAEDVTTKAKPESENISPEDGQLCSPPSSNPTHEIDASDMQDGPKEADAVTSTIILEALPQEGLSLSEAIHVLTQTNEDVGDVNSIATEPSPSKGCTGVSKVSSTTEEVAPPEKYRSGLPSTPKKTFSPGKRRTDNEGDCSSSSSMPLLHDEDSMMRTLNNLKLIPDALSPLSSPVRPIKRSHLLCHGKSLRKDFSSTAVDTNAVQLDVNKENKYPGTSVKRDGDKASDLPSSLSDNELEEGEILSESEEATAESASPSPKRAKLARTARNQPSPKSASRSSKKLSEDRCGASKDTSEPGASSSGSPPGNKSRFKSVCPTAFKASFSTLEDVIETFKTVRYQSRKKYMKLHKIFPKKSFYGMMDNFQESFLEFVDSASLGQICSRVGELKVTLKKMITSVFSKVSNNGIVNRIFDQQAGDLKQKLWDFVEVQLDFLFKEIHSTLTSFCKPARADAGDVRKLRGNGISPQSVSSKLKRPQKGERSVHTGLRRIKPHPVAPGRTGLGSRGKDIRMAHVENDTFNPVAQTVVEFFPPKNLHSAPDSGNNAPLVVSQNGSFPDRSDFEILTEQQASSLTFNLVRDSQMGEIFKCLLQGSDLLETSAAAGENTGWSISTPRKDPLAGESIISITTPTKFLSPNKFASPSKLITTWSSISPRKLSSPQSKVQLLRTPALFDESSLLVPSDSLISHRNYSILAEDLAVSLTIPSPLKSDSHLSFLQPPSMEIMSTPESVISAHLGEDALLDGEDATELDIHLALDTDNSCDSSSSATVEAVALPLFHFKPHLPMEAVVMEKSNDHFILKIRQPSSDADVTLVAEESLSRTITEEDRCHGEGLSTPERPSKAFDSGDSQKIATLSKTPPSENSLHHLAESCETKDGGDALRLPDPSRDEMEISVTSGRSLTIAEDASSTPDNNKKDRTKGVKRKRHRKKSKAKRSRTEEENHKGESESPEDRRTRSSKKSKTKSPSGLLSPNSLSAKNVVRKKGEVVMSWTRDDDRAILLYLQMKSPSRETFSALSEKLNKSSAQIADRFKQLMKLFKKQKMES